MSKDNKMDTELNPDKKMEEQWTNLMRYFIGNNFRYRDNIIIPKNLGPVVIKTKEEKMVESFFESCPFKTLMSCVIGLLKIHYLRYFFYKKNTYFVRLWSWRSSGIVFVFYRASVGYKCWNTNGARSFKGYEKYYFRLR